MEGILVLLPVILVKQCLTFACKSGMYAMGAFRTSSPPPSSEKVKGTISEARLGPTRERAKDRILLSVLKLMFQDFIHLHGGMHKVNPYNHKPTPNSCGLGVPPQDPELIPWDGERQISWPRHHLEKWWL